MLTIDNNYSEFILDLNKNPYDEHTIEIISKGENGNKLPWGIELVNNKLVEAIKSGDKLIIKTDYKRLKSEVQIPLKNYAKERIIVKIKPNKEALIPKTYTFEIKNEKYKNGELYFTLVSLANNYGQNWRCSYAGLPLSYKISNLEGKGTTEMNIKLITELMTEFKSKIIFTQEDSGKEVELILYNDKDGIKKAD
jgi:hypothetical protein